MKKRILSLFTMAIMLIGILVPVNSSANRREFNVSRVAGADRFKTSVQVSKRTFGKSNYVIVASGETFPDALVGGTLAVQLEAPILLVGKNNISSQVIEEIKRLDAKNILLLGGTGSISENVENKLKQTGANLKRLAGSNRNKTAEVIATFRGLYANRDSQGYYTAAINGYNFADALSAAPFVGQLKGEDSAIYALLPYDGSFIPNLTIGGTNSVPKTKEESRYAGSNRYGTAVEIAKTYRAKLEKDIDTVVLVDGTKFPDALSSAVVASENNGAILLTDPKTLSKETKNYIDSNKNIENIIIVGGENSVSSSIEKGFRDLSSIKPMEPTESENPTKPTELTEPEDPIKPTEPTKPEEQVEQVYENITMDMELTPQEKELAKSINNYRKSLGLKPLNISKSLTYVARTHVKDSNENQPENQKDSRGIQGNLHSWSNKGNWKSVAYTSDHKYAELMWSKPSELTEYKGNGYEISMGVKGANATPIMALNGWKNSSGHNAVITEEGVWEKTVNIMGVGIQGGYSHVWFGTVEDPAGYHITYSNAKLMDEQN